MKITFIHFIAKKYILINARNQRESFEYVQIIVHYIKFININNVENQLIFVYQGIIVELRVFINPFFIIMLISLFIQIFKLKKNI